MALFLNYEGPDRAIRPYLPPTLRNNELRIAIAGIRILKHFLSTLGYVIGSDNYDIDVNIDNGISLQYLCLFLLDGWIFHHYLSKPVNMSMKY